MSSHDRMGATTGARARRGTLSAATALVVYVIALIAIPTRQVVGPLGGAGSPAVLVGLACLAWWIWDHASRPLPSGHGFQPVRAAFLCFAMAIAASFVAAALRPIEAAEYSTATLGLVLGASWGGVLLLANDGIPDRERLLGVLRALVALGAAMAALGIAQFITGRALVDVVTLPGLSANHAMFGLTMREGFTRPAGTATHPIEYGAVLTMILPVALALAVADVTRHPLRRWVPVGLLALSVPLSISRSALVAGAVGIVVLVVWWPAAARRVAAVVMLCGAAAVYLLVPGMLGSLLGLFANVGQDSSAESRTGSYAIAAEFIGQAPVFGRGFSTFLPAYRILDNQYLGLLIETGVVGLLAFLTLIGAAVWSGVQARRASHDRLWREASTGLVAGVCAGATTMALFDGLSFPMAAGSFFLILGLTGASRRVGEPGTSDRGDT